ncbi:MAG: SDR family oxidoreductase [Fuerstiella sp.]|nr:SDR family oxidoreductase [Fuerstiella sp.]
MSDCLKNCFGLVTGSTQGIGASMAAAMETAGAAVIRHGLPEDSVDGADVSCRILRSDLSIGLPDSARSLAAAALTQEPRTNLLVCNAGTYIDRPFLEMPFATFEATMQLNVACQFVLVQEFARHWVKHNIAGRVVLTGSINGRLSEPVHVAYDTSKGAVEAMVRSMSVSLAPHGIRVNGVAPGLIQTPLTSPALDQETNRRWMELHTPNGSVPGPDSCAGAAVFLLSDAAAHVHGQMLFVDGGMSIWQQPDPPDSW